eukprot:357683-Pyramimonas_sp.AAC.1
MPADDSESPVLMREIEELSAKIEGSALISHLLRLPKSPRRLAIRGSEDTDMTIPGRAVRARVGLGAGDAKP